MSAPHKVLVIGDLFLDIHVHSLTTLPDWEEDCIVNNITLFPGGSAGNTARQLSAFGNINVTLLSVIAKDKLSRVLLDHVAEEKCNFILDDTYATSTCSCIVLSGRKGRSFITNRTSLKYLTPPVISAHLDDMRHKTYDHIHIGGLANCVGLHTLSLIELFITYNYQHQISLDLQMNNQAITGQLRDIFLKLCSIISILFVNTSEIAALIGTNGMSVFEAMDKLIAMCNNDQLVIVLKMGAKGSVLRLSNGQVMRVNNGTIDINIVDTTGAGDAFAAGFLGSYIGSNGYMGMDHLLYGTSCACLCIEKQGGCRKPIPYQLISAFYYSLKHQLQGNNVNHCKL